MWRKTYDFYNNANNSRKRNRIQRNELMLYGIDFIKDIAAGLSNFFAEGLNL